MNLSFQKKIILLFIIIVVIVIVTGTSTYRNTKGLLEANARVEQTHEVIQASGDILLCMQDLESGSRGFVITGDSAFMTPFIRAKKSIDEKVKKLEDLLVGNQSQLREIDSLKKLILFIKASSLNSIKTRNKKGFDEGQKLFTSGKGKYFMDQIREHITDIESEETGLLKLRQKASRDEANSFTNSFMLLFGCIFITLIVVLILIRQNIIFRNNTERSLEKSLNEISNFKSLFESTPGCFLILLPDFTIHAVSDEYLSATMTKREEIIGRHLFDVFPDNPDDLTADGTDNLRASLNLILKNKEAHRMAVQKYDIRNPDGTFVVRYWSPLNKPVINHTGEVVYLIHSVEDITIRLKHEEELKLAYDENKDLYNKAPCGYLSVDSNVFLNNINETFLNWLGYTAEEVIGKMKYEDLLSQASRESHLKSFADDFDIYIEKGYVNDLEFEFQRKDKTTFPAIINSVAVLNEKREFVKSLTTIFDITERKKAEKKLQDSFKEISDYKFALDESAIVTITDQKGIIKYVNDNFCRISKYAREDAIGQDHRIINSVYHSKDFIRDLWTTISNGKLWKGEIKNKAKDGTYYWLDTTIVPFLNNQQKPIQYISIRFDITLQKQQQEILKAQSEELKVQQEELQETNAELEAQSQNLQASEEELKAQQEELMQTNQELEMKSQLLKDKNHSVNEKNEELESISSLLQLKAEELALSCRYKSEFLANMSHELRTPLNSILLLSKLLSDNGEKNLSDEQSEFARVIYNSGNGLLELINDILDLSKIESGKMDIDIEEVELDAICKNVNALFIQLAKGKEISFSNRKEGSVPDFVNTDRIRVEQVLKNFLSNAFKFTDTGSIEMIVRRPSEIESAKIGIKANDFVSFEVKDTGIGIPKEKHAMVFEAFQQADGSTRRKYGGTGLGLSISREIARMLGGEILLTSASGKGSSFILIVPLDSKVYQANYTGIEGPESSSVKEKIKSDPLDSDDIVTYIPDEIPDDRLTIGPKDKAILIVEDDTSFASALVKYIHERGYKAVVAVNGADAIPFACKYKPIGILLDIQLPVKSGWTVMKELKENPQTKHIAVHVMSSIEIKTKDVIDIGAIDFIPKSLADMEIGKMLDRIESVLGKMPKIILLVDHNETHTIAISRFISDSSKKCIMALSAEEAYKILNTETIDCVVLDMGLPDETGYNVLEAIKKDKRLKKIPVIIYTGKSLSLNEENKLKQYSNSIVIKTADSFKRLSSQISLFLHLVENDAEEKIPKIPYLKDKLLDGKRVLIVDDDVRNIFSLTKLLESQKAIVSSASDGNEALSILYNEEVVDIILMDMMMPNKDGYETTIEIRKNEKLKTIPIIAVTAKAMLGDRQKCINVGASDYVTKPVDGDQLLSLLRVWLYK